MESTGDKIGRIACESAGPKKKKCLEYVRKAVQKALDLQNKTWCSSAKDAKNYLLNVGYEQIQYTTSVQNGDIVINQPTEKQKKVQKQGGDKAHGHIQIYYNGNWYSDFKQNTCNPYPQEINDQKKTMFRIE